jgi:hypothetical protein
MKEQDYILATNLARLQIAADVLHRVLPCGMEEETRLKKAATEVTWLLQRYYLKADNK